MERGKQNGGAVHPLAVWLAVAGAGAAGVSGIGSMGQLGQLNTTLEEQVRQAEIRGQLRAEIDSNLNMILRNREMISDTMPQQGVMELHRAQQALIDKLIDWTAEVATKNELNLAIRKIELMREKEKQ